MHTRTHPRTAHVHAHANAHGHAYAHAHAHVHAHAHDHAHAQHAARNTQHATCNMHTHTPHAHTHAQACRGISARLCTAAEMTGARRGAVAACWTKHVCGHRAGATVRWAWCSVWQGIPHSRSLPSAVRSAALGVRCCADHRAAPICSNGLRNGGETDLDCGGGCALCVLGRQCQVDSDCLSCNCNDGRHTHNAQYVRATRAQHTPHTQHTQHAQHAQHTTHAPSLPCLCRRVRHVYCAPSARQRPRQRLLA